MVKQNLTRAVELIGQALHPDHLKTRHKFTYRDDLLKHMEVRTDVSLHPKQFS